MDSGRTSRPVGVSLRPEAARQQVVVEALQVLQFECGQQTHTRGDQPAGRRTHRKQQQPNRRRLHAANKARRRKRRRPAGRMAATVSPKRAQVLGSADTLTVNRGLLTPQVSAMPIFYATSRAAPKTL